MADERRTTALELGAMVVETTTRLHVDLLGASVMRLEFEGGEQRALRLADRPRAMLAFLALSPGGLYSRADLLEILWDEKSDPGRGGFNNALWRLRTALNEVAGLGEVLRCDRSGHVGLVDDGRIEVDVGRHRALLEEVLQRPATRHSPGDFERLRQGVALYRGEPLAGWVDDWALREREKVRRRQLAALRRLLDLAAATGEGTAAIAHAHAILDIDPLREDVHRALMRLHVEGGNRAMALRQFEDCRAALRRALGIVPMPETIALYRRIADGSLAEAVPPSGEVERPVEGAEAAEGARPVDTEPPPACALADGELRSLIASARACLREADAQLRRLCADAA